MKRTLQLLFGLILAIALLVVAFWGTDPSRLLDHLRSLTAVHYLLLMVGMSLGVGHVLVRALRWRTLLTPIRARIPVYPLFATTALGYALSLLPAGRAGGELIRSALLGLRAKVPIPSAAGTIAVERLLDLVFLVALAAVALLLPFDYTGLEAGEEDLAPLRGTGGLMLAGAIFLLVLLAVAASRRGTLEAWTERRRKAGGGHLPRLVAGFLGRLLEGADALRSGRLLLSSALQSVGIWLVVGLGVWLMLLGCGVRASDIPLPGVFILLPALALGIAFPTPGGAGGYHAAMRWALETLFGVESNAAAAASVLHHVATWVPLILLAAFLMAREGVGVSDLSRSMREAIGTSSGGGER
jgi:uncharacterized protein (TIRG00374 family)